MLLTAEEVTKRANALLLQSGTAANLARLLAENSISLLSAGGPLFLPQAGILLWVACLLRMFLHVLYFLERRLANRTCLR